jgi:hypothetical protein
MCAESFGDTDASDPSLACGAWRSHPPGPYAVYSSMFADARQRLLLRKGRG